MKAYELMEHLYGKSGQKLTQTCDTIKIGDAECEIKKVAVCCLATVDVIKQAAAWGADLLITHEPTFYDHMDNKNDKDAVVAKKWKIFRLKQGI